MPSMLVIEMGGTRMSKDATRSIRLDGDVAQIAQKLADDKMLSHTLSKLLRQHYGLNTEIDSIKAQLDRTVNERMVLQQEEKLLADKIDKLEQEFMDRQSTELPILREKLDKLLKTHSKTKQQFIGAHPAFGYSKAQLEIQLQNQSEMIDKLASEIAKFESNKPN